MMKKVLDSFMNDSGNSFMDQFEWYVQIKLLQREDYSELEQKINEIEHNYPNVRQYLEDEKICSMTDDEKKAVLRIIELYRNEKTIELKEAFKLGGREMYIFLEEMDMLNI
ncbi:MAG: hypothetical protein K1W33_00695 [Clostridia bacterium]